MRVSGLASGIDTESIINDMMQANRIPLNKITQKKQYLEWQVDSYRAVNRQMNTFSQMIFDSFMNPTTSVFRKKAIEVSDENAVSIKGLGSSQEMSGTLQIHQLAQNASLQGKTIGKDKNLNQSLSELGLSGALGDGKLSIKVPGAEAKEITIGAEDTLQNVLNKINGAGVNAFYDAGTGKIAMTAKNSGAGKGDGDANIVISGSAAEQLGLAGNGVTKEAGKNAIFTYNGLQTERDSNKFEINGFEMTLKEVTAPLKEGQNLEDVGNLEVAEGGRTITFTSKADTDQIIDGIKNFVDEYNKMLEDLNGKLREQKYRSYHPLSAEEKADMKEKEIELWEEKAKSGTLRNDSTVSNALSSMRLALSEPFGVKGGEVLSSIGITTSKDYLANGKLEIDEDALRKALQEDPGKVEQMFTARGDKQEEQGFAVRLRGIADKTKKTLTDKAGTAGFANDTFTLGRNLKEMDQQIVRFQERLQKTEERLWRQFSAMEQAMNRANAQAQQLMNGLGGMM